MRIAAIGDIVGESGLEAFLLALQSIHISHDPDFLIVNGENIARGRGLLPCHARRLLQNGVDVITSGNHIWHKSDIVAYIEKEPRLLRPANFIPGAPGNGFGVFLARDGSKVCVANLIGRALMDISDDPFRAADAIVQESQNKGAVIRFFDFHAEATSEKQAMGYYLDGRASVVAGTHTHVQTADEKILPRGTAYITDIGMTGPEHSIIGTNIDASVAKFISSIPQKFDVADGICCLSGIAVDIDRETGKATSIERISIRGIDAKFGA